MDKKISILFFLVVIGIAWVATLPSVDEGDIQNQDTEFENEEEDELEPYDVADNEDQFQEKEFVEEVTRRRKRCGGKRCRRFQICKNSKCVPKPKKDEAKKCVTPDAVGPCNEPPGCCPKWNDGTDDLYKPICRNSFFGWKCNRCSKSGTECKYECCESETDPNKGGCAADGKCTDELIKTGGTCDPNDTKQKCSSGDKISGLYTGFCNETSKTCGVCVKTGDACAKTPCCPAKGKPDRGGCDKDGKCTPDCVSVGKSCEAGDTCCGADEGKASGYCDPASKTCKLCSDDGKACSVYSRAISDILPCCQDYSGTPIKGGCSQTISKTCSKMCISQGETCKTNEECCYDYKKQKSKQIICNPGTKKCDFCVAAGKSCSRDKLKCCFKEGSTTEQFKCNQTENKYTCG